MTRDEPSGPQPLLRIVRGRPDPAELAALTTVLVALTTRPAQAARRRSSWAAPARAVAAPPAPGPGGWRASALPR